MFRGQYQHTIDPKGRLSIPARFREELAKRATDTLVLTEGDHCVVAYPLDEWEAFEQRLRHQPQLVPEVRDFLRLTVGSAKECPVDRAGRTLVPPELRSFAALEKEVVIVGALAKFELWNRARWVDHTQRLRGELGDITRKLGELGL